MKYFSKIFIVMFILLFVSLSFCSISRAENNTAANTQLSQTTQTTGQITPLAKDTSGAENEIFSYTNVLNLILIAVGIVLILLSIAIFTRLKR